MRLTAIDQARGRSSTGAIRGRRSTVGERIATSTESTRNSSSNFAPCSIEMPYSIPIATSGGARSCTSVNCPTRTLRLNTIGSFIDHRTRIVPVRRTEWRDPPPAPLMSSVLDHRLSIVKGLQVLRPVYVAPHGGILPDTFAGFPGIVLGAGDEVEGTGPSAVDIALGRLLDAGIQLE